MKPSPLRHFETSPEIIRLALMMYVRFPLSLRNVEGLLHERGVDVSHETVRFDDGGVAAVGVEGTVGGHGADLLVLRDPRGTGC